MRAQQWREGLWIGLLILLICWLVWLIWGLAGKAQIAVQQAHEARTQYAALETRKTNLQASLDALQTPRGQDAAIREAFGVAKPGEEVIVVLPPTAATSSPPLPWWQQVLDWF